MCILNAKETKEIIDILNDKNGQAKYFSEEELESLKVQLNESLEQDDLDAYMGAANSFVILLS
jgi:PHD/YefM family antitoxin component YafN of YafNO toxin-antitoxin module